MRILISEDESDISHTYRVALESRNHDLKIANDGISCLRIYREELTNGRPSSSDKSMKYNNNARGSPPSTTSPFDVVVLDYKMSGNDGMELKRVVELLQKPFEIQAFIDTIEDKQVYEEPKKIMIKIRAIDDDKTSSGQESSESSTSRERMRDLFECLRKIQKNRTF
jgi:CheY-like chemotaxis protein